VLKASQALELSRQVSLLQTIDEGTIKIGGADDEAEGYSGPEWMRGMGENSTAWLDQLPDDLDELELNSESIKDPLFRFFNREIAVAVALLATVRKELTAMEGVCQGTVKLNNQLNQLKDDLITGGVPGNWLRYPVPRGTPTAVWIADFSERIKQYSRVVEHARSGKDLRTAKVWLGGLMEPAAFFTASRQAVAQVEGVSLEQLRMVLSVPEGDVGKLNRTDLICTALRFEGGKAAGDLLSVTEQMYCAEPVTILRWTTEPSKYDGEKRVNLPIYLNCARGEVLAFVDFGAAGAATQGTFYARGAALVCSLLGGA
jgi:dynein heavy chain 1